MNILPQDIPATMVSLEQELTALHEAYIVSVNNAVAANDLALADELARTFDLDARELTAERTSRPAAA